MCACVSEPLRGAAKATTLASEVLFYGSCYNRSSANTLSSALNIYECEAAETLPAAGWGGTEWTAFEEMTGKSTESMERSGPVWAGGAVQGAQTCQMGRPARQVGTKIICFIVLSHSQCWKFAALETILSLASSRLYLTGWVTRFASSDFPLFCFLLQFCGHQEVDLMRAGLVE